MDEKYRLVFRGEVLDGQHRAVVKRRLVESLKLTDEQAEKLFSGAAVVLKKAVDANSAARYQTLFKQAGGRLRVHSLTPAPAVEMPASPSPTVASATNAPEPGISETTLPEADKSESDSGVVGDSLSPPLTLLSFEEVDRAVAETSGGGVQISAPDFAIAELGEDLSDTVETVVAVLAETDFSLAATGVDLLEVRPDPVAIELGTMDFEVAEVGANLVDPSNHPVPDAPDTSHLQIAEEA